MMIQTLKLGMHTAYLDVEHGNGLLELPHDDQDVWAPCPPERLPSGVMTLGMRSMNTDDYHAALTKLDALGWQPSEDDGVYFVIEGKTADGCDVIGLLGRDPLSTAGRDDFGVIIESFQALHRAAGIVRLAS